MLSNLDFVTDKEKVLYSAIQLCPYNLEICKAVIRAGNTFSAVHNEIITYFGLVDPLSRWIIEENRFSASDSMEYNLSKVQSLTAKLSDIGSQKMVPSVQESFCIWFVKTYKAKLQKGIQENQEATKKILKSLSALGFSTEDVIQRWAFEEAQTNLDYLMQVGAEIKKRNPDLIRFLKKTCPELKNVHAEDFQETLKGILCRRHLSDQFLQYQKKQGTDVYALLSKAFGQTISSTEAADAIILRAVEHELSNTFREKYTSSLAQAKRNLVQKKSERVELAQKCNAAIWPLILAVLTGVGIISVSCYCLELFGTGTLIFIGIISIVGSIYYWRYRKKNIPVLKNNLAKLDQAILQQEQDIQHLEEQIKNLSTN